MESQDCPDRTTGKRNRSGDGERCRFDTRCGGTEFFTTQSMVCGKAANLSPLVSSPLGLAMSSLPTWAYRPIPLRLLSNCLTGKSDGLMWAKRITRFSTAVWASALTLMSSHKWKQSASLKKGFSENSSTSCKRSGTVSDTGGHRCEWKRNWLMGQ